MEYGPRLGPGAQANALYTMMSRDKKQCHLFLPLLVYEIDADRGVVGLIRERTASRSA